ncbi:MAG: radical SAM/SPASM domain-containing protein [Ahrensia sp.]|nr:radical SAM/SPASM domain-containing protein [Ahrensia sp.]
MLNLETLERAADATDRSARSTADPLAPVSPTKVRLEASTFCQLKCPTCETATGELYETVPKGFLRFDHFKAFLDEAEGVTEIELSNFGEVFLNPQLSDILRYAHERGVALHMANGANLNTVRDDVLEAVVKYGLRHIRCSIDGASQETYEQYRRRGNFDTVMANIDKINAFKKQYGSDYPTLTWQFVVFGHNEHEIRKARAMAQERGMDFLLKLNWDENHSPVRDKEMVRREMAHGAASRSEFKEQFGAGYMEHVCHQLWDQPQVNFDGVVWGCCRNNWKPFDANVFEQGLEGAMNSEQLSYARAMLADGAPAREDVPCTTCSLYKAMQRDGRTLQRG